MDAVSRLSQPALGQYQQRVQTNAALMLAVERALKKRLEMDTSFLGCAPQPTSRASSFQKKKGKASTKGCKTIDFICDLDLLLR